LLMPWPVYVRTTAQLLERAIGSLYMYKIKFPKELHKSGTDITFPISRNKAPGLHIVIAASRAFRVVLISFLESSSISPTA